MRVVGSDALSSERGQLLIYIPLLNHNTRFLESGISINGNDDVSWFVNHYDVQKEETLEENSGLLTQVNPNSTHTLTIFIDMDQQPNLIHFDVNGVSHTFQSSEYSIDTSSTGFATLGARINEQGEATGTVTVFIDDVESGKKK